MKSKKWSTVLLISSLVMIFSLGGSSISLGQEEVIKDLKMLDPENYLQLRGEKYAEVGMDPGLEPERINLPMTPHWESKSPPWSIGYSDFSLLNTWRIMVAETAKHEASKYPDLIKNYWMVEAGGDISKQVADIETLIAKKVDALIIAPGSPSALVPVIEKAYDMGIPVIVFHGRVDTEKFACSIQPDEYGMGFLYGDWLGKQLNGKGKIIGFKAVPGYRAAIDRWEGALAGISQYPDIKLLGAEFSWWNIPRATKAATDLLAAYPDFDGVLSVDEFATRAVVEALVAKGKPLVPMTCFEVNGCFAVWKKHNVTSIASNDPIWLGAEAVKVAVKILQGEPVYKRYLARCPLITEKERDKLYRPDMPDGYYCLSRLPEEALKRIFK